MGRFVNVDAYISTGQGIIGSNVFAYCNNSPVLYYDPDGNRHEMHAGVIGGYTPDYVIYYKNPESSQNLNGAAMQNHSKSGSQFMPVASFDEFKDAINSTPEYIDDVFIYLHGDKNTLCFYQAEYYTKKDIEDCFEEIKIFGDIYLFSCKGGRGELASAMANTTNCNVIASEYKVSFGNGYARCGWTNYLFSSCIYGDYTWYSFTPNGNKSPYSLYYIRTR